MMNLSGKIQLKQSLQILFARFAQANKTKTNQYRFKIKTGMVENKNLPDQHASSESFSGPDLLKFMRHFLTVNSFNQVPTICPEVHANSEVLLQTTKDEVQSQENTKKDAQKVINKDKLSIENILGLVLKNIFEFKELLVC